MASLWIRSGLGWPERDFEVVIQTYQVGARFEALDELIFMAPLEFFGIFLQPKQSHLNIVQNEKVSINYYVLIAYSIIQRNITSKGKINI